MQEVNFIIIIIFFNISFKAYDFIALHDIESGAELRWDYATVEYEIGNFPSECLCGAKVKKKRFRFSLLAPILRINECEVVTKNLVT